MTKLIVIVGITGNQGGSVAEVFLKDPEWKIRGISRNVTKASSLALQAKGIEMVQGEIDDVESLKAAFQGADVIFGNTAFSMAFADPTIMGDTKLKAGQTAREWCYELEVQQGKNIADAAASINGLELFIWSFLSDATKWSKGKYKGVYHFDSKVAVAEYIEEKYPTLFKKTSLMQLGLFIDNWKWGQAAVPWEKRPDGSMLLRVPGSGNVPVPFVIPSDIGKYAKALTQVPAGKNVLCFSDMMTFSEFVALWSKTTGVPAAFEHTTLSVHDKLAPGGYGLEIGEMYAYMTDFGYWGKDPSTIYAKDLGVNLELTSVEEYIQNEDWSELLSRPVPGA